MSESPELNELFTALAKAQSEMKVAGQDSINPFYKSNYSNFPSIVKASRGTLTKHGLCVIQRVLPNGEGKMYLFTRLCHASGQWMESQMLLNPPKGDVQSLGSYMTYAKRYSYAAITGVVSSADVEEDDDGNKAVDAYKNQKPEPKISKEEVSLLNGLIGDDAEFRGNIMKFLREHHNTASLENLSRPLYQGILFKALKRTQKAEKEATNG